MLKEHEGFLKCLFIAAIVLTCGVARAELNVMDSIKKIPSLKQGVGFSLIDNRFNYLSTIEIASYKGFALEAGYAGEAKNTGSKLVGVISYDLFNAKNAGVKIPVLDLIAFRPGVYVGYGRIEGFESQKLQGEFDTGISATIIDVKF